MPKHARNSFLLWPGVLVFFSFLVVQLSLSGAASNVILSDEFASPTLNSFWRFFDPLANAPSSDDSSFSLTGTHLEIAVPGGSSHNLWPGQMWAPRLLQAASDTDLEIEAKFDSPVTTQYEIQGLVVQETDDTLLRYEVHHNGSSVKVFAATITNGATASQKVDIPVTLTAPVYLRINRTGDVWMLDYSGDGQSWTTATTFTHSLVVTEVGIHAGNHPTSSPAFTAIVDYFRNTGVSSPIAVDDTVMTSQDTPAEFVDVLANDDANGQTIDVTTVVASDPPNGTVVVNATTGTLTYNPDVGFIGVDSFTYTVDDTEGDTSNAATVTVTVTNNSAAPIAVDDTINTQQDTLGVEVAVLNNDQPNGQTLNVTTVVASDPVNGTAVVNASTGTITYTPDVGFVGTDVFTYTVDDTDGDTSNTATVTATVSSNMAAPIAVDDGVSTSQDTPVGNFVVLANDQANGQTIDVTTVVASDSPNGSTVVNQTTGAVSYTPDLGFVGTDVFTYTVDDTDGDTSNVATVTVTVTATSSTAPIIDVWHSSNQNFGQIGRPQEWINIVGNVSDPNGPTGSLALSYSLNGGPSIPLAIGRDGFRLEETGDFNADIDADNFVAGSNTVELVAVDQASEVTTKTVIVNYTPGTVWPLPYSIDWTGASSTQEILNFAQVVDGRWRIDPVNTDQVRIIEPGYDRLLALGDMSTWENYEVETQITITNFTSNSTAGIGFAHGWKGHTGDFNPPGQPFIGAPMGALAWYRQRVPNPARLEISNWIVSSEIRLKVDDSGFTLEEGKTYNFRSRTQAVTGGVLYTLKAWEAGQPESTGSLIQALNSPPQPVGSLLLVAFNANMTFGPTQVIPIGETPAALDDSDGTVIATPVSIDVLANDDANGQSLDPSSVMVTSGPENGSTFVNTASGEIVYTPNAGFTGSDTFTYVVADTDGDTSNEATVTTTVGMAIQSDEFSSTSLSSFWTFFDPLAGGTASDDSSINLTGSQLEIAVPGGSSHNLWPGQMFAPRLLQDTINTDFEVEAKFDSIVSERFQQQGIVIQESDQTLIRYDVYHDGTNINVFAATITNGGSSSQKVNTSIFLTSPLYLRVNRSADLWTLDYSGDGQSWTNATSFTHNMIVNKVGVVAGNHADDPTQSPTFTASVDYFRNTSSTTNQAPTVGAGADQAVTLPNVASLDGTVTDDGLPTPPTLSTVWSMTSGPGVVTFGDATAVDTTASFTQAGAYVLRLTADDGALSTFDELTVTVAATNQAPTVGAGADQAVTLPNVASLDGTVTDDGLPTPPTLSTVWSMTSGPGVVTFGDATAVDTTASFTQAGAYVLRLTADDGALSTFDELTVTVAATNQAPTVGAGADQAVTLPNVASLDGTVTDDGLPTPPTLSTVWSMTSGPGVVTFGDATAVDTTASFTQAGAYVLRLTADDGALSTFDELTVTVADNQDPSGIFSDEFTSPTLNSFWRFFDPLSGAPSSDDSSFSLTGTHLEIAVPGGSSHNLWPGQMWAPRLLQTANDTDLEIEVKFDSPVTTRYEIQGVVVQETDDTLVRYEVHHNGTSVQVFAATITNGAAASQKVDVPVTLTAPLYLRINRTGNVWTLYYSGDGQNWTTATTFTYNLVVTEVGIHAGNHPTQSPAFTATVDYFRNNNLGL